MFDFETCNCQHADSPLRVVQLDADSSLHLVREGTKSIRLTPSARAEVGAAASLVLRVGLGSQRRPGVVGLVAIGSPSVLAGAAGLGQRPPREVLVARRQGTVLRRVAAGADRCRRGRVVLDGSTALDAKRVFLRGLINQCVLVHSRQVLGAGAGIGGACRKARFGTDLGREAARLAALICLRRLV